MNRLTTVKKMVEHLFKLNGSAVITIIDNKSSYKPLLDWYKEVEKDIRVIHQPINHGPWTFFYSYHSEREPSPFYVYTDGDLELNPFMPSEWQEIMMECLLKYDRKASLALRLDDIPYSELKQKIVGHQSECWHPTDQKYVYKAITDMTFSMDSKEKGYRFESVRLAGNFECRHIPWYVDFNNIDEEEKYYLEHLDGLYPEAIWSKINKLSYETNSDKFLE